MSVLAPARASTAGAERSRPSHRNRHRYEAAALVLVGPFGLLLLCTVLVPVGFALYLSLFTDRLSGLGFAGPQPVFVWFDNYLRVATDPDFLFGVGTVATYALLHVPLMMGGALVLALLLDSATVRLRRFWSLAVFLPYAVPGVITGLIWSYLYSPGIGPVAAASPVDPLSPTGVIPAIVNMAQWQWLGYNMIIFYTALQAVPREVLEAARIDGAGAIRTAWAIKVPLVRPTLFIAAVFSLIGSLQLFTEPMILRGVSGAINSTWTPSLYVYEMAFSAGDYGRAAAASVLLAAVSALLSALVMRLSGRSSS